MRLRWLLAGWTGLAVVVGLIAGLAWADREARCNESTSLFCLDETDVWVVTGALTAGIWLLGVLLLAVTGIVARGWSRRQRS